MRPATDAGGFYVFSRNTGGGETWGQVKKITVTTQAAGDELGSSVSLTDYLVLAGMPGDDTAAGTNTGSAVLFARNLGGADNYGLIKTFMPESTGTAGLRVSGSYLIVTFPRACPCENTGILTGEVSSDLQSWTTATPAMILADNASNLQLQIPIVPGQKKFVRFRVDLPWSAVSGAASSGRCPHHFWKTPTRQRGRGKHTSP